MPTAVRPSQYSRVSMLMQSNMILNSIRTNSVDLLKAQDQLTSGLKIARPSDAPSEATTVMQLDSKLERFQDFLRNMNFASNMFASADAALGQAVGLVTDAHSLALELASKSGHQANATVINSILNQLVTVGNTSTRGNYIFAGQSATRPPFSQTDNGIEFIGSLDLMTTRVSLDSEIGFSVDGNGVFGAISSRVLGIADLNPDLITDTLLGDLNGALGRGIRKGSIRIDDGVNPAVVIDLSNAVTVGDVINKINAEAPSGTTVSIAADGSSLEVQSTAGGANLKILEVGTGYTARDLGIFNSVGAGATVFGQDVDARLTSATPVAALAGGAGIDLTSGLLITNSLIGTSNPLDLSAATTMGEILATINQAGLGVRAVINDAETGINIFNQLSGSLLSIGENGGTTAADLGIRSMVGTTPLSDLNGGQGVHVTGQNDLAGEIRITDRNGATYDVDLSPAKTIQDVMDLINTASGGAVTAALTSTGNGIVLTNTVGGAGNLSVTTISSNGYFVAQELGLDQSVGSDTLTGQDVNRIEPTGLFSHLIALRDAMQVGDQAAINRAGAALETDLERLINLHGKVGSQMGALEDRKARTQDNMIAIERLRSDIRDVDFAEAVTRYQNLATALQANLMTASQMTGMSLLDFLR
ncbi:MAG: hypothetical protein IID32_02925 [Planctomycetes bacterium]|nr:hypothetical protein [Planctomycetota bacterium]